MEGCPGLGTRDQAKPGGDSAADQAHPCAAESHEAEMSERIAGLSDQALLEERAAIDAELKRRGLSGDIGEIGERLAIEYFNRTAGLPGLAPAPRGTKNIDAISRTGDRYSIKTLMRAKKTGTIYPSEGGGDHPLFEFILILTLSDRYELQGIYRLSWEQFVQLRSWDRRMNAWYLIRSSRVLGAAEALMAPNV
jgi:hypothetical protein